MNTLFLIRKNFTLVLFTVSLFLISSNRALAQTWEQLGADFNGPAHSEFGKSVSISADGTTAAFGLPGGGSNIGTRVQIFSYNGTSWIQKGNTIETSNHRGGESVSLSADGNIVCIGAIGSGTNGTNSGLVKVYQFNGSSWQQIGSNILGSEPGAMFGTKVSISSDGNTFAASAPNLSDDAGQNVGLVGIYSYNGTDWIQKGTDIIGTSDRRFFGRALNLDASGNIVIIGSGTSPAAGPGKGAVNVFSFDGTDWVLKGQEFVGTGNDGIGISTAISADGNTIAYGAITSSEIGQVKAYSFNGTDWVQLGNDMNGENNEDMFGRAISMNASGTILAIGAYGFDISGATSAGKVIINQFDGWDWVQAGQAITGESAFDQIGFALELSSDGNTFVVAKRPALVTGFVYQINPPLSIDTPKLIDISLYPNPSTGNFSLDLGQNVDNIELKITTLLGQVIVSKHFSSTERIDNINIPYPGLYLISVSNKTERSQILKLIIN